MPGPTLDVHDVVFSGAQGDRIRGWYLRPPGSGDRDVPVVVKFIGYGGGRGSPTEHTTLPATGYAVLVMDTRGQGGRWTTGATADPGRNGTGPENATVMTRASPGRRTTTSPGCSSTRSAPSRRPPNWTARTRPGSR